MSARLLASLVTLGQKLHQTAIKIDNDYKTTEKVTEKVSRIYQKYEISTKTKAINAAGGLREYVHGASKSLDGPAAAKESNSVGGRYRAVSGTDDTTAPVADAVSELSL